MPEVQEDKPKPKPATIGKNIRANSIREARRLFLKARPGYTITKVELVRGLPGHYLVQGVPPCHLASPVVKPTHG